MKDIKPAPWVRKDIETIKDSWREFQRDLRDDPLAKLGLFVMALIVAFFIWLPWLTD